jgi:hypothetical protein
MPAAPAALGLPAPPLVPTGGTDPDTASDPATHALVDLDGDCRLDLVVVDRTRGVLSVSMGLDGARFAPHVDADVGSAPSAVTAIDLDGDGQDELAVTHPAASEVVIVRATYGSTLAFAAPMHVAITGAPYALASGDFDVDGDEDLAVATASFPMTGHTDGGETVFVLTNDAGTLGAPRQIWTWSGNGVGTTPALIARDMDGDEDPDLVVAEPSPVAVLRNLGGSGFEDALASVGNGPVAVEDIDVDGIVDVISMATAALVLWPGTGDLHYGPIDTGYAPPGTLEWVATGELDGRPGPEVAVSFLQSAAGGTRSGIETITIGSDGEWSFTSGPFLGAGTVHGPWIATGDLDRSGSLDVIAVRVDEASSVALLNDGHGSFAWPAAFDAGRAIEDAVFADLDGDGHLDALVSGATDGALLFGTASGFEAAVLQPLGGGRLLAAGDVDGDGRLDVVAAEPDMARVHVFLQHVARRFDAGGVLVPSGVATDLALTDADGDTHLDVITVSSSAADVMRGMGDGTFAAPASVPAAGTRALAAVDLGGDHRPEIVLASTTTLAIATNDGSGGFGAVATSSIDVPPMGSLGAVAAGDLDGDGAQDLVLLARGASGARVLAWRNGGTAFDPAALVASTLVGDAAAIAIGDVDADGHADVVALDVPRGLGASVSLLRGRGDGTLEAPVAFALQRAASHAVVSADHALTLASGHEVLRLASRRW